MGRTIGKKIIIGVVVLIALNLFYLLFMTACYSVPMNERARVHLEETMEILAPETKESPVFRNVDALSTGLFTDMLWIDTAIQQEDSALYMAAAMPHKEIEVGDMWFPDEGFQGLMIPVMYYYDDPNVLTVNYSRYWMLFTGLIRVLFQFLAWNEIRYFFWTVAALLLLYDGWRLMEKCGWRALIPFGLAVMMRNLLFHVISFTTCTDSIGAFAAVAFVVTFENRSWYQNNRGLIYAVIGSLTFAIGTMEAPLLVLGMALITDLLLQSRQIAPRSIPGKEENKKKLLDILAVSVCWCIGYMTAIIGKGVFAQIVAGATGGGDNAFFHYISSNGGGIAVRFYRIFYCLNKLFSPMQIKIPLMTGVIIILLVLMKKRGTQRFAYMWHILLVGCYPIVWAFIVVEHSMHNYASNIFSVLVYGVLALLCGLVKESAVMKPVALSAVTPGQQD